LRRAVTGIVGTSFYGRVSEFMETPDDKPMKRQLALVQVMDAIRNLDDDAKERVLLAAAVFHRVKLVPEK
jgi:hypothetical protein